MVSELLAQRLATLEQYEQQQEQHGVFGDSLQDAQKSPAPFSSDPISGMSDTSQQIDASRAHTRGGGY
jgi:hypothetical protein